MALKPGDKYYTGLMLNFDQTLRRWAMQASFQLRDSYRMQKMWDGTKSNSVWIGRKKHYSMNTGAGSQVTKAGGKMVSNWSWYDEVMHRRQAQEKNPRREYWFPTGMSYQISQHNPVTVVNGSHSPIIDFATTMGVLYAEAGVGKNGPRHIRGKDIKVDRKRPWSHTRRYVSRWQPGKGKSHRPNTRQQLSLFARRLRWAAHMIYEHDLVIYIGSMLEKEFTNIGKIVWRTSDDGMPYATIIDKPGQNQPEGMKFEEIFKK